MQTFIDAVTGQGWAFENDVIFRGGQFFAPHDPNTPLPVPTTLVPGELPEPIEPEPYIPQSVTRRQARLALIDAGKLLEVENAIAAIQDPMAKLTAQVEYEADTWERGNPFLQNMWAQLGGTETELDDLFILANTK